MSGSDCVTESTMVYRFVNKERYGAEYVEYFTKKHDGVSYTLTRTEACRGIIFESELTEKEKDAFLSRDGTFEVDIHYGVIDTFPSEELYDVFVTGEENIPEDKRSVVPEEVRLEVELVSEGEICIGEYEEATDDVWVDTRCELILHGGAMIYEG